MDKDKIVEDIKKKLEQCEKEKSEFLENWKREKANFENYKKDEEKRIINFSKTLRKGFAEKLLPILDNLDLSENYITKEEMKNNTIKGFMGIKKQIEQLIKDLGVEKMETTNGDKYDEKFHEAISREESEKYKEPVIIEVSQSGYFIDGIVLRPAKVKVGIPKEK